jgi:hypothetical protein
MLILARSGTNVTWPDPLTFIERVFVAAGAVAL